MHHLKVCKWDACFCYLKQSKWSYCFYPYWLGQGRVLPTFGEIDFNVNFGLLSISRVPVLSSGYNFRAWVPAVFRTSFPAQFWSWFSGFTLYYDAICCHLISGVRIDGEGDQTTRWDVRCWGPRVLGKHVERKGPLRTERKRCFYLCVPFEARRDGYHVTHNDSTGWEATSPGIFETRRSIWGKIVKVHWVKPERTYIDHCRWRGW